MFRTPQASSSSYGKVAAPARRVISPTPEYKFQPELPPDPQRQKVTSSSYGKVGVNVVYFYFVFLFVCLFVCLFVFFLFFSFLFFSFLFFFKRQKK